MNKGIYYRTQRVLFDSGRRSEQIVDTKQTLSLAQLVFSQKSDFNPTSSTRMCCCCTSR